MNYEIQGTKNKALVFKPEGTSPFPAIIYNHGMVVDLHGLSGASTHGYKLAVIYKTLADLGYYVFAPIKKSDRGNMKH